VTAALRVALYLLVADGIAALYLGGFIGLPGLAVVALALAATWWREPLNRWLGVTPAVGRIVVPAAAVAAVVDVAYLAETILDGLVRLVLFLIVYKLATLGPVKDTRPVGFLAFFLVVAASSSAFDVNFLFVFVTFVVLGTWVTLLQHVLLESEPAPERRIVSTGSRAGHGRGLFWLALAASASAVVITGGLFFVIPRIGLAALPLRAKLGPMVTGFTDRVELGAYGAIETDATVAMRVYLPDERDDPAVLPGLRWRGIVFDAFDGQAWIVRHPRRVLLEPSLGGEFWVNPPRGVGRVVRQEFFLEPIGTDIVFAAPRALRFGLRPASVSVDDMGSVAVSEPAARVRYTVDSELEDAAGGHGAVITPARALDPATRSRFLQLPPMAPRVGSLAREIAGDGSDPHETARRLTGFLSREYQYTLLLERRTALDPVEEFLFVRRSGNCEYFAAALAVMLRSLGVPARVVGGFQRGEWNPYGRYFIVRLSDAHAWVEAHLGGAGWVTLDPSPRAAAETSRTAGGVRLYLDALRMRWHRYVINWSLRDQVRAAGTIRRHAVSWGPRLSFPREWSAGRSVVVVILGALAAGLLVWLWQRRHPEGGAGGGSRVPRFYARALRALTRQGLRPQAGETAREFCLRVGAVAPTCAEPFERLTTVYEHCRFGAATLGPAETAELDGCLVRLSRPPARRSTSPA